MGLKGMKISSLLKGSIYELEFGYNKVVRNSEPRQKLQDY